MGMMTAPSDLDYRDQMLIDAREDQEPEREHCARCGEAIEDCVCGFCFDGSDEERG